MTPESTPRELLGRPRGRTSPTWCCGRSSTPTTSSPTGSPTAATDRRRGRPARRLAGRSAGSGRCSAGSPATSRSPWSSSGPRFALARHQGLLEGGDGVGSAREAFAAELRDSVRRVNIIGEIAAEVTPVVHVRAGAAGERVSGLSAAAQAAIDAIEAGPAGAVGRRVLRPRRHPRRRLHRGHVLRRPAQGPRRRRPPSSSARSSPRSTARSAATRPASRTSRFSAMRGESEEAFADLGERLFVQRSPAPSGREARALVKAHQRPGHTVAVASAATKYQIAPVARDLGIEHLVCTAAGGRGRQFTGATDGPLLWGAPKASGVRAFAARARASTSPSLRLRQRLRGRRLPLLRRPPHRAQPAPRPARRRRAPRLAGARPVSDPVGGSLRRGRSDGRRRSPA